MTNNLSEFDTQSKSLNDFAQEIAEDQRTIVKALAIPNHHNDLANIAEKLYNNVDCHDMACLNVGVGGMALGTIGFPPAMLVATTNPVLGIGLWAGLTLSAVGVGMFSEKGLFSKRFAKLRWKAMPKYRFRADFVVQDDGAVVCEIQAGEKGHLHTVCSLPIGDTCPEEIAARTLSIKTFVAALQQESKLQFQEALQYHGITAKGYIANANDPRIVNAWGSNQLPEQKMLPAVKEEQKMLQSTNKHLLDALQK